MIPPTQPTPHVIMMRSLLEMAIPLRINPTYANIITLLQKVNYHINQHVLLSLVMSMPIFVISWNMATKINLDSNSTFNVV